MNKAEKLLLVISIYVIGTWWFAEASLDSLNIPGEVWWTVAILAAWLFVMWPNED